MSSIDPNQIFEEEPRHKSNNKTRKNTQKRFVNKDKSIYEGDIEKGKRNGMGTMTWKNEDIYKGYWKNGLRHGKGSMRYNNGELIYGIWENDEIKYGTHIFENKNNYTGHFKDNQRSGEGTMEWYNDEQQLIKKYQGEWLNDRMVNGNMDWYDNGNLVGKYGGEWLNNKPADGTMVRLDDRTIYIGTFNDGKRHGQGKIIYHDENSKEIITFEGNWENDDETHGTMIWKDGSGEYEGEFENGKRSGKGTMKYFQLKKVYVGEWYDDAPNGEGIMTFLDPEIGMSYSGTYNYSEYPIDATVKKDDDKIYGSISHVTSTGGIHGIASVKMSANDEDDETFPTYLGFLFYKKPGKSQEYDEYEGPVVFYKDGALYREGIGMLNKVETTFKELPRPYESSGGGKMRPKNNRTIRLANRRKYTRILRNNRKSTMKRRSKRKGTRKLKL